MKHGFPAVERKGRTKMRDPLVKEAFQQACRILRSRKGAEISGRRESSAPANVLEKMAGLPGLRTDALRRILNPIFGGKLSPKAWNLFQEDIVKWLKGKRLNGKSVLSRVSGTPYERLERLIGPELSAGDFMLENPYNGFTVYKGSVGAPFLPNPYRSGRELFFMSGRPTVALDYHVRPTGYSFSYNPSKQPLFAVGDARRSKTFLGGERFFTPQSASTRLNEQISAVSRQAGTQRFYRTGYHHSSDFPDFEITLPYADLPDVFNRYYTVSSPYLSNSASIPFGYFAEHYPDPKSFKSLPFSFRQISDPEEYVRLSDTLSALPDTISRAFRSASGLFRNPVRVNAPMFK